MTAFTTRAVHAGNDPAAHNGAVTTPIYQTSTFVRPHARPVTSGWDYSRIANPTRADLEECLAALEGGASAVAVASGMAACVTVLQALGRAGGHVVIPDNVYGGTWDLVHDVYPRWGLAATAVDMADLDAVAAAVAGIGNTALSLGGALGALEVNPLWVNGSQGEALDVLVVTEPPDGA